MGAGGLLLMGILHESQSIHRAGMKSPTAVDPGPFGLTQTSKARRERNVVHASFLNRINLLPDIRITRKCTVTSR
jgi:hypothetical protein